MSAGAGAFRFGARALCNLGCFVAAPPERESARSTKPSPSNVATRGHPAYVSSILGAEHEATNRRLERLIRDDSDVATAQTPRRRA